MEFELRPWRMEDAPVLARHANNKKIADNLRDGFPHPYTPDDAKRFISACLSAGETRQCLRAISIDGEAAGSIGVFLKEDVYAKDAELGYWLAEPYWGRGVMTKAVRDITARAFAVYDIVRIFAEPFAENAASRRVLERAGFTLEGVLKQSVYKNGRIQDSCIYYALPRN
jgi:ribosomal-protein-alanine N-acetyltransferase